MFHDIPAPMRARMNELQALDRQQRASAAPPEQWVRAVPPETGALLALLAASAPTQGTFVELGTGSGYSTLWLTLAVRERTPRPRLVTIERSTDKAQLARETFTLCGVSDFIEARIGDAAEELKSIGPLAFAFMDHGPRNYAACREALVTALVPGGLLAVDNIDSHREITASLVVAMEADARIDCTVLHVGKGVLLARKCAEP